MIVSNEKFARNANRQGLLQNIVQELKAQGLESAANQFGIQTCKKGTFKGETFVNRLPEGDFSMAPLVVAVPGWHKGSCQGLAWVRIKNQVNGRKHRLQVQCGCCGKWVPSGRLNQHKCNL